MSKYIPREEHPRPDFMRKDWLCLNGEWEFSFDKPIFDRKIIVPFVCESQASGIHETKLHSTVWYRRTIQIPPEMKGKRIHLHFGAVDHSAWVWVNGSLVTSHFGGQTGFSADITDALNNGEGTIIVKVVDDPKDLGQLRGKQYWEEKSRSIFYTRSTGIWQTVWIEAVEKIYLKTVPITSLFDEKAVKFEYVIEGMEADNKEAAYLLETEITFGGRLITTVGVSLHERSGMFSVCVERPDQGAWNFYEDLAWSPEHPRLFDVQFRLLKGRELVDEVYSYFGMRKVGIKDGKFLLNGRPYFQKLILDQGYWPDSLMTAPTDEAFVEDIKLIKAMGFNGVRLHQKVEDPRFLYHADRMGLLVWGEIGSAYIYSIDMAKQFYQEWSERVMRDIGHPCIVTWVPLNESWGIQEIAGDQMQQAHSMAAYQITRSLDVSRPVIDNDGWEHSCGDLLTIHDYESDASILKERYADLSNILNFRPAGKEMYVQEYTYTGNPIIVSEYGGIKYVEGTQAEGWGYSTDKDPELFLTHLKAQTDALFHSPFVAGFCYTQLCDIETEQNGLLTYDRKPKIDIDKLRNVFRGDKL